MRVWRRHCVERKWRWSVASSASRLCEYGAVTERSAMALEFDESASRLCECCAVTVWSAWRWKYDEKRFAVRRVLRRHRVEGKLVVRRKTMPLGAVS